MKCMRCGTEIAAGSVFCDDCLAEMEKHPVKPGTPVYLPRHEKQQAPKRSKKRTMKAEDHVHILRRVVIWLIIIVLILSLALTATIYKIVSDSNQSNANRLPGQNYDTSSSASQ